MTESERERRRKNDQDKERDDLERKKIRENDRE